MPSVLLWACLAENLFLFAAQKNLRIFLGCFFTEKGRGGNLHFQTRIFYKLEILSRPICRLVSIYKL